MTRLKPTHADWPIGVAGIAELLKVPPGTVNSWNGRSQLPEPDYGKIGRDRVYSRGQIVKWAIETGRMRCNRCGELITPKQSYLDGALGFAHDVCPPKENDQ